MSERVVWEYEFPVPSLARPHVQVMPVDAKMVHTEYVEDSHIFHIWVEVAVITRHTKYEARRFQIWGTGDKTIPEGASHVATGIDWEYGHRERRAHPKYVWHLYDVTKIT